jgi:hypothetical protein
LNASPKKAAPLVAKRWRKKFQLEPMMLPTASIANFIQSGLCSWKVREKKKYIENQECNCGFYVDEAERSKQTQRNHF